MIILQNEGLIDLDVIKIMGVNVKDGDNSIGVFGTGLKYAIAVFLREGIDFSVMRGLDEYAFTTEEKTIRGKSFDLCVMHGPYDSVELGFTTELGKNWEVWQAYREIHSNCLDENGDIWTANKTTQKENHTSFCIDIDIDINDIFLNKAERTLLYSDLSIEIYEGSSSCVYYRGIKAKHLKKPSIHTYNILRNSTLTEDRLLCYDYEITELIANTVSSMNKDEANIIKAVVTAPGSSFESDVKHCHFVSPKPSKSFIEACKSEPKTNSQFITYIDKHTPIEEKSEQERKKAFIVSLRELCNQFDVSAEDSETTPTTFLLQGGILMADDTND